MNNIKVIDRRAAADAARRLGSNIDELNDCCGKLAAIDSIFPVDSVAGVRKVSAKWLRKYVDSMVSAINGDTRLPSSFKQELCDRWERVYNDAHELCDRVNLIANFDGLPLHRRGGKFFYLPADVEAFVARAGTVQLDGEQTAYLALLQEVAKSLNAASDWERSHGYVNTSFTGANTPTDAGTRHISLLDLFLMNDDGTGCYSISPEAFVSFIGDGILGKEAKR